MFTIFHLSPIDLSPVNSKCLASSFQKKFEILSEFFRFYLKMLPSVFEMQSPLRVDYVFTMFPHQTIFQTFHKCIVLHLYIDFYFSYTCQIYNIVSWFLNSSIKLIIMPYVSSGTNNFSTCLFHLLHIYKSDGSQHTLH